MPEKRDRPVVRVKPLSYVPTEAELNEPIVFPPGTTPRGPGARPFMTPVRIVKETP